MSAEPDPLTQPATFDAAKLRANGYRVFVVATLETVKPRDSACLHTATTWGFLRKSIRCPDCGARWGLAPDRPRLLEHVMRGVLPTLPKRNRAQRRRRRA